MAAPWWCVVMEECRALLAEARHAVPEQLGDLRRRIDRFLDATDPVAECTECGQDVPVQSGPSTLRTLRGRVAAGGVSVDDAAHLIETWPTSGGAS